MPRILVTVFLFAFLAACNHDSAYRGSLAHATGDQAQAIELWSIAAHDGVASAQFNLGYAYDKGEGVSQDSGKAAEWYRKAADQGAPMALNNLGALYFRGSGVSQDRRVALEYYYAAARAGNRISMRNIGYYYRRGLGVVKDDYARAYFWYSLAIKYGDEKAEDTRGSFEYLLTEEQIIDIKKRVKKITVTDPIDDPYFKIKELESTSTMTG